MNKKLILIISMVLVALAVAASGCTWSPYPESGSKELLPQTGIIFSQQNTGIWVTGEGEVTVVPDVAILNLGVEAQATTVAEAQKQAAQAMNAVMDELDGQGVAEKDIKTQHYSIYPVRRWAEDKEILIGYRVTNTVTAKIRNVDNTGIIIDAVARAGGDYIRINGITFTLDDPTKYHKEAREKAMADAEEKAKQLADSAGVKLGKTIYISESGGYVPIIREYAMKAEGLPVPVPAPPPISPGETEVRLNVQVVYSIK